MQKLNHVTPEMLTMLRSRDTDVACGREWLPCGAEAAEYWQDERGGMHTACAAGCEYYEVGGSLRMWRRVKSGPACYSEASQFQGDTINTIRSARERGDFR